MDTTPDLRCIYLSTSHFFLFLLLLWDFLLGKISGKSHLHHENMPLKVSAQPLHLRPPHPSTERPRNTEKVHAFLFFIKDIQQQETSTWRSKCDFLSSGSQVPSPAKQKQFCFGNWSISCTEPASET